MSKGKTVNRPAETVYCLFVDGNKVSAIDYFAHLNRYKFAADLARDKICLDIGCGMGYGAAYLARKGASRVVGGDKSGEAIDIAAATFKDTPRGALEFRVMEATALPFADGSFDVVVCFEVLEHVKDFRKFVSEMHRVLKSGGKLILSTPNQQAGVVFFKIAWKYHSYEFSERELRELLASRFNELTMYGQYLLDRKSTILRRLRQTAGRLLETLGLRGLEIWLGRLLFRHNRLVVYQTSDFDNFGATEGEVLPLIENSTPITFLLVATKP